MQPLEFKLYARGVYKENKRRGWEEEGQCIEFELAQSFNTEMGIFTFDQYV